MPDQHAKLSPSASERWLSCPASVRVVAAIEAERGPEPDSPYAAEGTKAHALAELEAGLAFGKITKRQHTGRYKKWLQMEPELSPEDLADMRRHVADYVSFLADRMDLYPNSVLLLEQRLDTGVPTSWGTSDAVIVSPDHVEIVDLKYGAGVPVNAVGNPQLRLYALGALDTYGDLLGEAKVVRMTVFQPRLDSVSTEELDADELRAWRESIIPIAEEAIAGSDRFGPSEAACRWCPAAGECRARVEKLTQEDFGTDPDLLSPDELGDLLGRLDEIKSFVKAVEETGLRKAYSEGQAIPGWKVVMSTGNRRVDDVDGVTTKLGELGIPRDQVVKAPALKGIGDLEKLVRAAKEDRKVKLEDVLGDLVGRNPGKPSLVPEDDPREAANPNAQAAQEFAS